MRTDRISAPLFSLFHFLWALFVAGLVGIAPRSQAGGVVSEATEASVRAALAEDGAVTFACDGTIALSRSLEITNNTVLDASGRNIVLDGQGTNRVFYVAPGANLALTNLIVWRGRATAGGGLLNDGGEVTLANCTFAGNSAVGLAGADGIGNSVTAGTDSEAGAIQNKGTLEALNCFFLTNSVEGGPGGNCIGDAGPNSSPSGVGGNGGSARGGAIATSGRLTLLNCLFEQNYSQGGKGGGHYVYDYAQGLFFERIGRARRRRRHLRNEL